jgi:hypothetical protein
MDSLPEEHIDTLPKDTREDALWKISAIGVLRGRGLPEDEVAERAGFSSVEDMYFRLKRWALPGLVPPTKRGALGHAQVVPTCTLSKRQERDGGRRCHEYPGP